MNKKLGLTILSIAIICGASSQQLFNVDAKTFADKIELEEGIVLDVRTPGEYSRGHIKNATLISTSDQEFVHKVKLLQKDKPIYVYCLTGSRSRAVSYYLYQNGYAKVYNLQRGIVEWNQLGYPIEQSNQVVASANKTYSTTDFSNLVNSNTLVLVNFHAPWCAPCKKMAPMIEDVKNEFAGKAKVEKVDIESNKSLQTSYEVQSIPGLILFKDGKEVWRHTGVIEYNVLTNTMNKYL